MDGIGENYNGIGLGDFHLKFYCKGDPGHVLMICEEIVDFEPGQHKKCPLGLSEISVPREQVHFAHNYMEDEDRSPGVGLQEHVSNHLKLRGKEPWW